jgi:hypothetical protein
MANLLIDYTFKHLDVANPNGSSPMTITNGTVVDGPGDTAAGKFNKAVDLGQVGKGAVSITGLAIDYQRFAVRIVFSATGPVTTRQNLVESNLLPFALMLAGRPDGTGFDLIASVAPKAHGWRAASTRFAPVLTPGTWYVADLVYDIDTVGVFVDGQIVSVHAFPQGEIAPFPGTTLFVGTWADGARDHFNGKIAALQLYAGVPDELEAQLDERRTHPEWYITHKLEAIRPAVELGAPTTAPAWDPRTDAYLQQYEHGAIMYNDGAGTAFEMHGAIATAYKSLPDAAPLGYLVSDEMPATKAGGRKNVFSRGAIYWSAATGAVPVQGRIYLDYEAMGESGAIGFPVKSAAPLPGGREQEFQGARMYHKSGTPRAYEVHGAILAKYLALGGPPTWGFPVTNESDVKNDGAVTGKFSEFENCTIYWSAATGAFEVHGDIRRKYLDLRGPIGELGFPTSDETAIPGVSGPGRYNSFKNGSLLWYGSFSSIVVARPFRIYLGRINARESESFGKGENDMYIYIKVIHGGTTVFDKRRPSSGAWEGKNIVNVNYEIPVTLTPDPSKSVSFSVDVRESDIEGDDHLGKWTKVLNVANGWGQRENNGILDSGSFSSIRSITASIKPTVSVSSLSETQKFWGVANRSTDDLTYQQYASAFSDVDSDSEVYDPTDWLDKAFFELVVQDIAEGGNCFGMSLEAIYARKGSSLFSLPLDRFTTWNTIRNEVNIKHPYQVGAAPIWWFVEQFLTGNTHDPSDVFKRTRTAFDQGSHPVLCLTQNYDFTGSPHCILPVAWDDTVRPWRITICDPNFPNDLKFLTVNPDENSFEYAGSSRYSGGSWTGGRLHYMPFSILCSRQRTPVWDAILLLLAGTILILGEDTRTASITNAEGLDLDGHSERATAELKAGRPLNDFFVGFKGYGRTPARVAAPVIRPTPTRTPVTAGRGTITGEILARMPLPSSGVTLGPAALDLSVLSHLRIGALNATRNLRSISAAFTGVSPLVRTQRERLVHHVANDPQALQALEPAAREAVLQAVAAVRPGDFRHEVVGVRAGTLQYTAKHGLTQFRLESTVATGELTQVEVDDLGASTHTVRVKPDRDKEVKLEVTNKLGVGGDRVRIRMERLPVRAGTQLQVNLKPGLGGLEFAAGAGPQNIPIEVEAQVGNRVVHRRFAVPLEGGARVKLSTILSQGSLGVSRIDQLFGPTRGVQVIPGTPVPPR